MDKKKALLESAKQRSPRLKIRKEDQKLNCGKAIFG